MDSYKIIKAHNGYTAYDIAGKNIANGQSMRNAIYLALDILKNRNR